MDREESYPRRRGTRSPLTTLPRVRGSAQAMKCATATNTSEGADEGRTPPLAPVWGLSSISGPRGQDLSVSPAQDLVRCRSPQPTLTPTPRGHQRPGRGGGASSPQGATDSHPAPRWGRDSYSESNAASNVGQPTGVVPPGGGQTSGRLRRRETAGWGLPITRTAHYPFLISNASLAKFQQVQETRGPARIPRVTWCAERP